MNEKCGTPPLFATFEYVGLYYGQQPAKFLGCFLGMHFRSHFFKHSNKINKHWLSFIVRLAFGILFSQLCAKLISDQVPFTVSSVWEIFFLKGQVPAFLNFFLIFALPDQIVYLLKKKFNIDMHSRKFEVDEEDSSGNFRHSVSYLTGDSMSSNFTDLRHKLLPSNKKRVNFANDKLASGMQDFESQ